MPSDVESVPLRTTHGVEIATYRFGGEGPPLFVGHCTGFHVRAYRPLIDRFAEHFEVYGIDFRGHGSSTAPSDQADGSDPMHWSNFADDLLAALDAWGLPSVRVFAHSLGGAVTLLAEKKRPGLVEAAWLYEPIVFPTETEPRNDMMMEGARKRRSEFGSRAEALERFASRPPLGRLRADVLAAYVAGGTVETADGVTLACAPEIEARTYGHATTPISAIAGLTPRITIGAGRTNAHREPEEWSMLIADALPNAQHVVYDDLSHFGPLEGPDRVASDAIAFLR